MISNFSIRLCSDLLLYSITKARNLKAQLPDYSFQPDSLTVSAEAKTESSRAAIQCLVKSAPGVISTWIACALSRLDCLLLCRWQPELMFTAHQCRLWECVSTGIFCERGTLHTKMVVKIHFCYLILPTTFLFCLTFLMKPSSTSSHVLWNACASGQWQYCGPGLLSRSPGHVPV